MKTTDERVQTYLSNLRSELKGADKATVQDALADAEEHLRTALAAEKENRGEVSEEELLAEIIQEYGPPGEVAEAYKTWEQAQAPALARPAAPGAERTAPPRPGKNYPGFFGVYADPRAWGGLVFMLISLVTGTLYFSWATAGLSTSLGLMITIIGIPVTILFLLSVRGLIFLEGRLVEALLGERMPRRPAFTDPNQGWIERLKQLLLGKSTWLGLLYMGLMLPLGVVYFSLMVSLLSVGLALVATPILVIVFNLPVTTVSDGVVLWQLPEYLTPLVAVVGVLLTTVTLHLSRWVGWAHGRFAKALLVSE